MSNTKTSGEVSATVAELAAELIRCPSVTPQDAGCQAVVATRLAKAGFHCESLPFAEVSNLWARYGDHAPLLCLAGHTDVVPAGETAAWNTPPFDPVVRDGYLFGRGAADMKGGLAAMIVAAERFVTDHPALSGSLAFLVTGDEEGVAVNGTKRVLESLYARNDRIDWCVVGEPSSTQTIGDTIRIGRRGSLSGRLVVQGQAGHVAYPDQVDNPVQKVSALLAELHDVEWDQGNAYFPPTSFQVVELSAGGVAANVTPAQVTVQFNFRYSNEWHHETLERNVEQRLAGHGISDDIGWQLSGEPFLTKEGRLTDAVSSVVQAIAGGAPQFSTGGGTSDGRFFAPRGIDVVELGPVNRTIHQANECVAITDLGMLSQMYYGIMTRLFAAGD